MKISILFAVFATVIIFKFDDTLGCYNQLIKAHDKLHPLVMGSNYSSLNQGTYVNCTPVVLLIGTARSLTPDRPLIQLWCPRSKLNMDDFSVLAGP